jgi:ELWxxDGT repeat protein
MSDFKMTIRFLFTLIFGGIALLLTGQTPQLVKDLNPGTNDGISEYYNAGVLLGNRYVFTADDGATGLELFALENDQVSLVKDINPGTQSSTPVQFVQHPDGTVYFLAQAADGTIDLWRTDGTVAGTELAYNASASNTTGLTLGNNNLLYFSANDKCYESDGTEIGTIALTTVGIADFTPDFSSTETSITAYGNSVAFVTTNGQTAYLWTVENHATQQLGSLPLGSFFAQALGLTPVETGFVFFVDNSFDDNFNALWAYHTATDTLVKLGSPVYVRRIMPFYGKKAVFYQGTGYYATDGTIAGTVELAPVSQLSLYQGKELPFAYANGKLLVEGKESFFKTDVMVTDGTPAGTGLLVQTGEPFLAYPMVSTGSNVYFATGTSNGFNAEIWQTATTPGSTSKKYTYTESSPIRSVIPATWINGFLYYFSNIDATKGRELFKLQVSEVPVSTTAPAEPDYSLLLNPWSKTIWLNDAPEADIVTWEVYNTQGSLLMRTRQSAGQRLRFDAFSGHIVVRVFADNWSKTSVIPAH